MLEPRAVAVDGAGSVFIGDTLSARVGKVDTNGQLSFFAGDGGAGTPVAGTATGQPVNPISLAVDASGKTLWVGSQPEDKLSTVLTGRGG
jgi:hypothetical protein